MDGNGVEWLKVVDKAQGATLLFDTEPSGVVRHIGMLIHARSVLILEYLYDFS